MPITFNDGGQVLHPLGHALLQPFAWGRLDRRRIRTFSPRRLLATTSTGLALRRRRSRFALG
jgi:hypothetical protein